MPTTLNVSWCLTKKSAKNTGTVVRSSTGSNCWPQGNDPIIYLHARLGKGGLETIKRAGTSSQTPIISLSPKDCLYVGERKSETDFRNGFQGASRYKWLKDLGPGQHLISLIFRLGGNQYKDSGTGKNRDRQSLEFILVWHYLQKYNADFFTGSTSGRPGCLKFVGGYQFSSPLLRSTIYSHRDQIVQKVNALWGI